MASGYLIDRYGDWELPFLASVAVMAIGTVLALRMRPEQRFENEPSAEHAIYTAR